VGRLRAPSRLTGSQRKDGCLRIPKPRPSTSSFETLGDIWIAFRVCGGRAATSVWETNAADEPCSIGSLGWFPIFSPIHYSLRLGTPLWVFRSRAAFSVPVINEAGNLGGHDHPSYSSTRPRDWQNSRRLLPLVGITSPVSLRVPNPLQLSPESEHHSSDQKQKRDGVIPLDAFTEI
jgi:hypothetical protein